jgi:hypothetical protein
MDSVKMKLRGELSKMDHSWIAIQAYVIMAIAHEMDCMLENNSHAGTQNLHRMISS